MIVEKSLYELSQIYYSGGLGILCNTSILRKKKGMYMMN